LGLSSFQTLFRLGQSLSRFLEPCLCPSKLGPKLAVFEDEQHLPGPDPVSGLEAYLLNVARRLAGQDRRLFAA
jgi:hypothetical protein